MPREEDDAAEIKDDIIALKKVESQIEELKKQLEVAQRTRDKIQERLAAYRASQVLMSRLPNEMLSLIFGFVPEAQKTRNRNLQLVSRLWRDIVLASPCLWNDIVVELKSTAAALSSWKYAAACLVRSKDTLLDISIAGRNFETPKFLDPTDNLLEGYRKFTKLHPSSTASRRIIRNRGVLITDHTTLAMQEQVCVITMDMTFSILKGHDNQNMGRWRSFIFELYEDAVATDEVAAEVWNSLQGQAGNLVNLEFRLYGDGKDLRPSHQKILYTSLSGLGRLEAFRTDLAMPCDELPGSPHQLRELQLYSPRASNTFARHASSSFSSLRILGLYFPYVTLPSDPDNTIELPLLEMLYLRGKNHALLADRFSTPRLNHLGIMARPVDTYPVTKTFSSVKTLSWNTSYGVWEDDNGDRLESLLKQMESLVRIRFWQLDEDTDPVEVAWVQRLKLEGSTSSSLTVIQIIDKAGHLSEGRVVKTLHI